MPEGVSRQNDGAAGDAESEKDHREHQAAHDHQHLAISTDYEPAAQRSVTEVWPPLGPVTLASSPSREQNGEVSTERPILGVDVGGTKVAVGSVADAQVGESVEHPTDVSSTKALLDGIEAGVRELIERVGEPAAIGLGVPSQIEFATGRVMTSVNIPLAGVPLREELGERFGVPVVVDNDANCAALAEAQFVDDAPAQHLLMLTLGTGVGGGAVIDGAIFRGRDGLGVELGHVSINPDGPRCLGNCPNHGCLEAYCSGSALERDAGELAKDRPDTLLGQAFARDGKVTGRELVNAAEVADHDALADTRSLLAHARDRDRRIRQRLRAAVPRDRRWALPRRPPVPRQGPGRGRVAGPSRVVGACDPLAGPRRSGCRADRGRGARRSGAGQGYCKARHGNRRGSQMTEATTTDTRKLDTLCIDTIRTLSMDAVEKAGSGHPGTPMALAPLAYLLYTRVMKHSPSNDEWFDRDRFVLSAGHASMLLYSVLYLSGYGLELEDLKNFRQVESPTAGHPERKHADGIETTTGPLGQGISNSVGLALAERMLAARFNRDGHELIDHFTYTIASDGDLQEGVASEACSLAGHLRLGRLIAFYDDNHISIEGDTELSFSERVGDRFEAYGWHVQDLGEDIELDHMERAIDAAKEVEDRPSLMILRTHIAQGAPNKQDTHGAHGAPLGEDEVRLTKEAMGWPPDEQFLVPEEALEHFRAGVDRGKEWEEEWNARAAAYREEHPELWEQLSLIIDSRLPEGWDDDVPEFGPDEDDIATRKASSKVIQWASAQVPQLVGGSADLAPSTNTLIEDAEDVAPGRLRGRNLHFGVREHGMGAIVNGLALHGFRAYGATFFIFFDYMKAAMRLAALMHLPSIYVFTHDSIGLGEDGPTHQPIEQLATLRAQPNTYAVRPADANETGTRWRFALEPRRLRDGAGALAPEPADPRSRPCPTTPSSAAPTCCASSAKEGEPDVILIGTGSEVSLCIRPPRPAGGRGGRHARGLGALHRPLCRAGRRVPRQRAAAVMPGTGLGGGGRRAGLGALGDRGRRGDGHDHVRGVRAGRGPATTTSASRRRRWPPVARK